MEPASKKTRHAFPTYDLTIETSVGCVQTYSAYACTGSPVLRQILEKATDKTRVRVPSINGVTTKEGVELALAHLLPPYMTRGKDVLTYDLRGEDHKTMLNFLVFIDYPVETLSGSVEVKWQRGHGMMQPSQFEACVREHLEFLDRFPHLAVKSFGRLLHESDDVIYGDFNRNNTHVWIKNVLIRILKTPDDPQHASVASIYVAGAIEYIEMPPEDADIEDIIDLSDSDEDIF